MMRAIWRGRTERDHLADALAQLAGWTREGQQIKRTLRLDETQHAALTERIKIVADVLHLRPAIRRLDGHTQIKIRPRDGENLTEGEITLAARVEDAYRAIITAS